VTTETLEYVRLGMTELSVSPIAFGTWELGGEWRSFDEAHLRRRYQPQLGLALIMVPG
jgi:aryl-alcohol dehydrogenase-like predicted oxidoreductase